MMICLYWSSSLCTIHRIKAKRKSFSHTFIGSFEKKAFKKVLKLVKDSKVEYYKNVKLKREEIRPTNKRFKNEKPIHRLRVKKIFKKK